MPPVSEKQRRAMFAAAEGRSNLGIPQKVGEEFVGKDAKLQAAGTLFVAPDGDILLLRRSGAGDHKGEWCLPGGGLEGEETADAAARREAEEEIGIQPEGKRRLLDRRLNSDGTAFTTFAQMVAKKFAPTLNDEHTGYAWAGLHELPAPLHPDLADMLQDQLGRERSAEDMSPNDWDGLVKGFLKWIDEEEAEEEHAEDDRAAHDEALVLAFDRESVRHYDADGRLHVELTPISKGNICPYWGREIPNSEALGLAPDKKYMLLRHPEELRRAADTFNNLPLLRRHVPVSAGDHRPEDVIGSTGTDAEFKKPYLMNSLVIWAKDDIADIERDLKKELSSAYRYRADMTPGTFEGEPYDGVMRDIVGNHVALVKEGRAGPDVVVGDSKENLMPKTVLTRKAALVQGALIAYLAPRLAADAKIDVSPLLAGIDHTNYPKRRAAIEAGVAQLAAGRLAADAKIDGLGTVLLALDAVEPEAEDGEEESEEERKKREAAEAKAAKDRKARDKKARDTAEELKERLKGKLSEDEYKAACDDIDGMMSEDEDETDEEKKEREAKAAARDRKGKDSEMPENMVTKKAMDAALKETADATAKMVRDTERGIRTALADVQPWVGELPATIAFDSKIDVYRHAAVTLGVSGAKTLHADALWPVIQAQPRPGARPIQHLANDMAADEASVSEAQKIAPGLARIKTA